MYKSHASKSSFEKVPSMYKNTLENYSYYLNKTWDWAYKNEVEKTLLKQFLPTLNYSDYEYK